MENKQLIISVGREFGSGGHVIAEMLAKRFDLPLFDHNLLDHVANEKNLDVKNIARYDEVPKKQIFSRTVRGYSNSPEVNIAQMQFDFLRRKAEKGESFVIVGRCSEEILKDFPGMISIFILGDLEKKIARIAEINHMTRSEAEGMIYHKDKKRKSYHNYYCEGKWGDSRNYELSINSSKLGLEGTADVVEGYIRKRMA